MVTEELLGQISAVNTDMAAIGVAVLGIAAVLLSIKWSKAALLV